MDASKNNFLKLGTYDGSFFDLFDLPRFCSENLTTYVTGSEATRVEKEAAIADFEPAQKFLTVCGIEYGGGDLKGKQNCSKCIKCVRTMSGFYAMGKLDNFREVFDVDDYKAHLGKRLGRWFAAEHGGFVKDFKRYAKMNNVRIPLSAYFYKWLLFRPWEFLRKTFRHSRFARKMFYKFRIDYLMNGYRYASAEKYKDLL